MSKVYETAKKFKTSYFKENEELFRALERSQSPETLFVTCSDSRIAPSALLDAKPGELFILRNVANIIPPYDAEADHCGILSAVEYAVCVLKVKEVIICGHSNCGGCAAALHDDGHLDEYQNLSHWIGLIDDVKQRTEEHFAHGCHDEREKEIYMEQENVKQQVENLMTHPKVLERFEHDGLIVEGWYYDIATGVVSVYRPDADAFIADDE